jgi:hypothetical protein
MNSNETKEWKTKTFFPYLYFKSECYLVLIKAKDRNNAESLFNGIFNIASIFTNSREAFA